MLWATSILQIVELRKPKRNGNDFGASFILYYQTGSKLTTLVDKQWLVGKENSPWLPMIQDKMYVSFHIFSSISFLKCAR